MTLIMLFIAHGARTPPTMWIVAMICDTVLIATYMYTKAH
jgi:hypothetical protein